MARALTFLFNVESLYSTLKIMEYIENVTVKTIEMLPVTKKIIRS